MPIQRFYPDRWKGIVPHEYHLIREGQAKVRVDALSSLVYLQHLCFPSWKPVSDLRVLNVGTGTGEPLIEQAMAYPAVQFWAADPFPEVFERVKFYAGQLALRQIHFLDTEVFFTQRNAEQLKAELGCFDLILMTRPLQHFEDLNGFLEKCRALLHAEGALLLFSWTGEHPETNLYLQEKVQLLKLGELSALETETLLQNLNNLPFNPQDIDTLKGVDSMMSSKGFRFYSGLHPANYDPASYFSKKEENRQWFQKYSVIEKAFFSEQIAGSMLRHALLYTHQEYSPKFVDIRDESAFQSWIPFQSPFFGAAKKEERFLLGLVHHFLALEKGIEFEDLSLPERYFQIFWSVDGHRNFEQIYRRFLPMSWDEFREVMIALYDAQLIHLHCNGVR